METRFCWKSVLLAALRFRIVLRIFIRITSSRERLRAAQVPGFEVASLSRRLKACRHAVAHKSTNHASDNGGGQDKRGNYRDAPVRFV